MHESCYIACEDDVDDVVDVWQNAEIRFNFGDTPFKYPPKVLRSHSNIFNISYFWHFFLVIVCLSSDKVTDNNFPLDL